jgi:hypothetical protein
MAQPLTEQELEKRFTYHAPTDPRVRDAHDEVRALFMAAAMTLNEQPPAGREASLAFTSLEDAAQWCHAAIARDHTAVIAIAEERRDE